MPRQATVRQGSPAKRDAIFRAALAVFAREGYARASVDVIAAEAGVSKRTIYDYFGGKERLFLSTVEETEAAQQREFEALLARTLDRVDVAGAPSGLAEALTAFARELAGATLRSPERAAVVRLIGAEAGHFADLRRRAGTVGAAQRAIAERLTRFAGAGLLRVDDPVEAAEFLGLLVIGRVHHRSLYGAVALDDAELDALVTGSVGFFLRACGPPQG